MGSLFNKKVRDESKEKIEQSKKGKQVSKPIKFQVGSNYIGLLSGDVNEGYFHYVETPSGENMYGPCLDQDGGWDPDNCPLCKIAKYHFTTAKGLKKQGKKSASESEKDLGKQIKASFHALMLARKGRPIETEKGDRVKFDKKERQEGKIVRIPSPVQKLSLTKPQYEKLIALADRLAEEDQVKKLVSNVLEFFKEEDKGDYGQVMVDITSMPNSVKGIEIPEDLKEEIDNMFKIENEEELRVTYSDFEEKYLSGEYSHTDFEFENEDEEIEEEQEPEIKTTKSKRKPSSSKSGKSKVNTKGKVQKIVVEPDDEFDDEDFEDDVD